MTQTLVSRCAEVFSELDGLELESRIDALNAIREELRKHSPFQSEPVDCVLWIKSGQVKANDYNPNSVAPPEMELLRTSIRQDGYTQPIVGMLDEVGEYEVIDGFHRHRVGKECAEIQSRIQGYLPLVQIRTDRTEKSDRMASTIRHNRARGKHKVEAMSDIVVELKRRNWSDEKISKNLGMDPDEVLRLCQITGLAEAFADQNFSQAWEAGIDSGVSGEIISDVLHGYAPKDGSRILHTWDKWECFRAGFYAERPPGKMTQDEGEEAYRAFLSDHHAFEKALATITTEWKHSCEHYLTNDRMNRIAWLGQASVACALGIPSGCRAGYGRLEPHQQRAADELALAYLNRWLEANGRPAVTYDEAGGRTEAELY